MKIGIITESLNRPKTGVELYLSNLLSNFDVKHDIYCINYKKLHLEKFNEYIISNPFKKLFTTLWYPYVIYTLKNTTGFNIIHNPRHFPTIFNLKHSKYIITVHDIFGITLNSKNYETYKKVAYRLLLPKTLKSADKIIAVSENTKNDLIKHFKIPPNKIKVIYNAANETFAKLNEIEISNIKKKYAIDYPFIFYVGGLAAHKNIVRLIESYSKLKMLGVSHKLLLAGVKRYKYNEIFETIEKLNLQKDVVFTGYVPDEDLPGLYNAADLFVYPSFYEGFGLPPLEAMQCGTPVITSNTSSLPEVVGDAGIMVNPYDVDELANKMYEVLTNEDLRKEMSKKGLERAKLFSWKKCAEEHLKVYEEVYTMK
ncbi:glycosyltransferase involved in cell wall biosynthesis [Methanococcus maripaludis]|uniref:Glycosyltransferase involved in cell wall biosynthesis n=1 Tax=Methanococcus maripaludis TaxID=39152 RepID=A0A7J9P7V6_METMI|nr:glycosyltransferase family 1 protein [Methanococcus maripaludis]MBA2858827.1 glycosyltransferase involved in cell wall biosynthesis [Methanococcus maripaludis]